MPYAVILKQFRYLIKKTSFKTFYLSNFLVNLHLNFWKALPFS